MKNNFLHTKQLSLLFLMLIQSNLLFCQKTETTFNNSSFDLVIKTIEEQTDYIFNYDPSLLSASSFSGKLDLSKPQKCIAKLLYDSPFDFEVDTKTVLIYKPEPSNFKICGRIQDARTKTPLIFANVIANDTNFGIQTDEKGYFETTITAYKNQRITISYIGYTSTFFQLQEWTKDDCMTIDLSVDEQLWKEDIIVSDYILDGISEGQHYNGYQLNYHQLAKHHSTVEHDILKTAQLLPGITSLDESANNLQIRGSALDQNLILWEGVPIYQSGHVFGMISAFNPFSVNKVNIFKGVYDPKYDNRVGGIIDISLSDSIQSGVHGSAGMTLTEGHFNIETPLIKNKLSLILSGRHSTDKLFNSPSLRGYTDKVFQFSKIDDLSEFVEEGALNANRALTFYDWNAKVLYKATNRLFIKAGAYQNSQNFQYDLSFTNGDPFQTSDKIVVSSEAIHTAIAYEVNKKWKTALSFIQSKYVNEFNYKEEENSLILRDYIQFNDILDQSAIFSNTYTHSTALTFNAGYDYNSKRVNYNFLNESINEENYEDNNFEKGSFHNLFVSSKFRHSKFNIEGGSRATFYQEKKHWVISPRFSVQYAINKQLKLKTEAGIFHQFISQLRDYGSNNIIANNPLWIINVPDSDLSQKANKIAAGFIYQNKGFLIDIEGYYNRVEGLSSLSPLFNLLEENAFTRGRSKAIGVDVLIKKRWAAFNTWVNYSLGKITYLFPGINEISFFAPNDIRHNLSFVSSYTYKKMQVSLTNTYHSGLPFTKALSVLDFYDEEDEATIYSIEFSEPNQDRLRPYFRTDFAINYRPVFKKNNHIKTEVSLSLLNILNRKNVFARKYHLNFNENLESPKLAFVQNALLQTTPLILIRVHW